MSHKSERLFWESIEDIAQREEIAPELGDEVWDSGLLIRILGSLIKATVGVGFPYSPDDDSLTMVEVKDGVVVDGNREEFAVMINHMHEHGGCFVIEEPHRSYGYMFLGGRRVRPIPSDTLRAMVRLWSENVDDEELCICLDGAVDAPMMVEWLSEAKVNGSA